MCILLQLFIFDPEMDNLANGKMSLVWARKLTNGYNVFDS